MISNVLHQSVEVYVQRHVSVETLKTVIRFETLRSDGRDLTCLWASMGALIFIDVCVTCGAYNET